MGTGGFDVGLFASFFGIPGGYSFERNFSRHSPSVVDAIISVGKLFMYDVMYGEIRATMTEKYGNSMTEYEINNSLKNIKVDNYDKVDKCIRTITISVSYDMR